MDKLSKYLFLSFFKSFTTLFGIITAIVSLIFIISISNVTADIQINFTDLLKLYFLKFPQVVFIALSISFIIASSNTLAKISETQELVALLSLGISPKKILKPFFFSALLITFINLIILFISIPYSKSAYQNLKNQKKQEAKFNLQSKQISQQFGEWYVFATQNSQKNFSNIYLFNKKNNNFILASSANLNNKNGFIKFTIRHGKLYDIEKNYKVTFENMKINKKIPKTTLSLFNIKDYFSQNKKIFTKYFPIALIPISLFLFIPIFGFFHPRLHKDRHILYSLMLTSIYISLAFANKNLIISIIIPIIFFILGGITYIWKRKF
ncbi:LptF/LptG family permease [Caminibacter sp.]